jgi:septum formation protein
MHMSSKPLIYLASASPRRSALLTQIGVAHEVRPVDVDERAQPAEQPHDYVRRVALLKAQTLRERLDVAERSLVLGSDTAVVLDGEILGKPSDEHDCARMLRLLSGRTHQVFTAVALCGAEGCESEVSVNDVTFRTLSSEEITAYWRSGEPADKAGGYAVQGHAAVFIERIAGSYSAIMGLPLYETAQLLASAGVQLTGTSPAGARRATQSTIDEVHG